MATRSASRAARRAMSLRLIICSGLTVAVTAEGGHGWPRAAAEAGGDLLVNGQGGAEHDDAPRGVLQLTDVRTAHCARQGRRGACPTRRATRDAAGDDVAGV